MGFINDIFGSILSVIFDGVMLITPVAALGISIILFTLVARILLTPLQLSSQRTSRGMSKIQPEMQKIQNKYKGKKDQQSQLAQSQEMQALYKKYKINPFAGCLPLLIQLPLIMALFNVLREPAKYITRLGIEYTNIAATIMDKVTNYATLLEPFKKSIETTTRVTFDLSDKVQLGQFLSHLNTVQWQEFLGKMGSNESIVRPALDLKYTIENFLGFNVVDTPSILMSTQWWVILIPIIAGASTYIFTKLTMATNGQAQTAAAGTNNGTPNSAESMMKTMNIIMPIMTGVFAYTMPIGLALYWIAGNIIMMGQQWIVNKILEKQDAKLDAQLEKEREEARKNNKVTTKKVMKKVPVEKKTETKVENSVENNNKPKTYTKTVIKKVPVQKKSDNK